MCYRIKTQFFHQLNTPSINAVQLLQPHSDFWYPRRVIDQTFINNEEEKRMQDLDILKFFSGSSRRQRIQAFILNFSDEAHRHATALFQERHYHPTAALFCASGQASRRASGERERRR